MSIIFHIILIFLPLLLLAHRPRREVISVAALVGLFLVVHIRFLTGEVTVSWDTMAWATILEYVKEVVQAGHFPDWNPYLNAGEPLYLYHYSYAMWQWFLFVAADTLVPTDPVVLFNVFFVSLYVFYNVGCYLFFTKLFDDARISLFCFAVSLFSVSFVIYFQEHTPLYTSLYLPYMLYFFLEAVEEKNHLALFIMTALIGMAANIYLPHFMIIAVAVFVSAYFALMKRDDYHFPTTRSMWRWGAAGAATAAALILPVLYVFMKLPAYVSPVRGSVDGIAVAGQMLEGYQNDYLNLLNLFSLSGYNIDGVVLFIGVPAAVLLVPGLWLSKNRMRKVCAVALIFIFALSLGSNTFLYKLVRLVPTFDYMRHYVALNVYAALFAVSLAGMGLEGILKARTEEMRRLAASIAAGCAVVVAAYLAAVLTGDTSQKKIAEPPLLAAAALAATFATLYIAAHRKGAWPYRSVMITTVIVMAAYQWYAAYGAYPEFKYTPDRGETAKLTQLMEKKNTFEWPRQRHSVYKQSLIVGKYVTFEAPLVGAEPLYVTFDMGRVKNPDYLFAKSIIVKKYFYDLLTQEGIDWSSLGAGGPKLFLTRNYAEAAPEDVAPLMGSEAKLIRERLLAVFEEGEFESKGGRPGWRAQGDGASVKGTVSVTNYGPNYIKLNVDSPTESLLVNLQGYDDDWRAFIDGDETPVYRTNHAFQAIAVPDGKSVVEFRFNSPYRYFLILHIIGVGVVIIAIGVHSWRRNPPNLQL